MAEVRGRGLLLLNGQPRCAVPLPLGFLVDDTGENARQLRFCRLVAGQAAVEGAAAPLEATA